MSNAASASGKAISKTSAEKGGSCGSVFFKYV